MAIGIGSTVSPKSVPPGSASFAAEGPLFGISESAGTPFTILWNNGQRVASVPLTSVDEIVAGSGTIAADFVGRRVQVNSPAGQNVWGACLCVGSYNRNGSEVLLLQNQHGGYYLEALASNCTALTG